MTNIPNAPSNIRERSTCRRVILKIIERDGIDLETLLEYRYFSNFGHGVRLQLFLMLKEKGWKKNAREI